MFATPVPPLAHPSLRPDATQTNHRALQPHPARAATVASRRDDDQTPHCGRLDISKRSDSAAPAAPPVGPRALPATRLQPSPNQPIVAQTASAQLLARLLPASTSPGRSCSSKHYDATA